ncbi:MAG: 4-(cytidine 5'-diphospho)-2-C-methyl-D-erythritol kinase [Alphaproteobacteria bacterium]|nr:4-(cytidine 5'-diphospho)-2-C-methyl-D-erythritol kinase [Alphaproteobacteria bacterium]
MSSTRTKTLTIFAPAKINLYLHVTGRLDNGYHSLDSLVAFADIGDQLRIEPAQDFEFEINGPYARMLGPKEQDASPHSGNLVVQAAWALARAAQKVPNVKATLTKNLPIASGLGGGSSDAAAMLWGLLEWWELSTQAHYLPGLMARIGADIPVCLPCKPARMRGIGDILDPAPPMGEAPIVLVNPAKACLTADVFRHYSGTYKEPHTLPDSLLDFKNLIAFLKTQENDLYEPACAVVPEIRNVMNALEAQKGCALARLSGSGATCFGLFEDEANAQDAARSIAEENPDWWVKVGWLNRPERY